MREWTWTARRRWSIGCACFYHFCHSEALCAERMSLRVGIVIVVVSRWSCSMNVMLIRSSRVGRAQSFECSYISSGAIYHVYLRARSSVRTLVLKAILLWCAHPILSSFPS